ncbi:hypothetical protein [Pseudomonas syringae]|uniref:Integrase n=1 Tax=Pseudomonas syringae TaxID=317 RepID=A0A085VAC6_PSESX|nr:hypothetical protein [Pseudomonas syringae]KFE52389.1 hypothetical protein IV02_08060 [Pseudomonas syringae]
MNTLKHIHSDPKIMPSADKNISIAHIGMDLNDLNGDSIISNDRNGQPIFLKNLHWDFPLLGLVPTDSTDFSFEQFITSATFSAKNLEAAQLLLATYMFSLSRNGREHRVSTIYQAFKALRAVTKSADERNITIQELISSPNHIAFAQEVGGNNASALSVIIRDYLMITSNSLKLKPHNKLFDAFKKAQVARYVTGKQTPVIPSRILHAKYHQYNDIIHDFINNSDNIRSLAHKLAADPCYGRDASKVSRFKASLGCEPKVEKNHTNFIQALNDHDLQNYSRKYGISCAARICTHLHVVQHSAKCLVHIYTLVRDHEAKLLEDECVQPAEGWNSTGLYMMGVSTKLTGSAKDTAWIANELIIEPINTLKLIKSIITPHLPKNTPGAECLILTPAFLPFSQTKPGKTVIPQNSARYDKYLPKILIENADIVELEAIDPLADWRSDPKYKVGKPWIIASHQFRRTMAVFGAQSQMLDIPELKRLLTHLTESMSIYYQRGCSAGGYNMNMKSPELAKEFKNAMNDAQWISYLNEVLYSSEKLHGGHGERVTTMSKANDPDRIIYRQTAEETMQKAKKGLISYQRTPLGGCASSKPCNARAHGNFTNCFGCESSVLKASNVKSVIEHAQIDLMDLDPKSFEYRMEQRNIQDYEFILNHLN